MPWRIHEHVLRGEIDNRIRGRVTGRLWLAGVAAPLVLELKGDCHPDLAGCSLAFANPQPVPMTTKPPALQQRGTAGDITAARRVKVPDVPIEEFVRMKNGPWHWANSLYLEWFSERSGRVVVESADYELRISEPVWRFTPEELASREQERSEGSDAFATEVRRDGEEGEWDEFRHEQMLRESEALSERYGRLLDKYQDHPDSERIIAREMGWEWLEEELDREEENESSPDHPDSSGPEAEEDEEESELPAPDPAREGIDWVRDESRGFVHPIEKRASDAVQALLQEVDEDLLTDAADIEAWGAFLGHCMTLSAKLAGALRGIARGRSASNDPPFTIALLKRILEILNQALAAADALAPRALLPEERLAFYRTELFTVRESILTLIARLRA